MDTYIVQVYCNQCKTFQSMAVPKGEFREEAENMKCPNCGIEGDLQVTN